MLRPPFIVIGCLAAALIIGGGMASRGGARTGSHFAFANAVTVPTEQSRVPEPVSVATGQPTPLIHRESPREAGNDSPTPPPLATTATTFSLIGGTTTFSCSGNVISLDSALPNAGFTVEAQRKDGGRDVEVKFESERHRSEVRATCVTGLVQAAEIQEESA
jgi:hypothetical protein